jgi:hypothetical protein
MIVVSKGGGALMERGPMALFGALVAIGLGPALWLGAQFGDGAGAETKPPAVTSEVKADQDQGGVAGAAPEDPPAITDTTQRRTMVPLSGKPTATPTAGPTATKPAADDPSTGTTDPTTEPTPSDETTAPATEPATEPTTPDGDDVPPQPPVPPGGSDEDPTGGQGAGTEPQG